jgi:hypothetical protein
LIKILTGPDNIDDGKNGPNCKLDTPEKANSNALANALARVVLWPMPGTVLDQSGVHCASNAMWWRI